MMAKNKELRPPTYSISVVGLSGTEKEKGTSGVGKSCLCNRYVHPKADDYYPEHTSVLSTIDFGGRVVNNDHFLFWGDVSHMSEEGTEYKVQVIEQTEFIDDQTFLPHRSTNLQLYIKRAAASKLQSAEKLMYICTDQLGLEQDFEQKQMPDGKLTIDGFLLCIDVSKGCNRKFDDQLKFVNNLVAQLAKTKKPVVIAATKCDECVDHYLREVQAFATNKKNMPVVETSARFHVNVDLCFATLIQLLDKTRGKPKIIPYLDAYKQQRQLVASATDKFEKLIVQAVKDYHADWKTVSNKLKNHFDYEEYVTLEGTKKAKNTFSKHIEQLKQEHVRKRREEYIALLPKALNALLPELKEIEQLNWTEAQNILEQTPNFPLWFVVLEKTPWDETEHIDNINDKRLPFDILSTSEGEKVYHNHVQHLISERRRLDMKEKFKKLLEKVQFITPGKPWEDVLCFVMDNEACKFITDADRREVYSRHQREIVEKAKEEFQEMLFEHSELFYDLDLNATPKMNEINTVLSEEPRYRALQKLAPDRESLLLKHIGFVYHPTKETCLSSQNCMDIKVEQLLSTSLTQLDNSRPNVYQDSANIDKLILVLLGRDGLAQELANEIRVQCTDDEYTLDGKIYELDLQPVDLNTFVSSGLTSIHQPHGYICVYNSMESLGCMADCIERIRSETTPSRKGKFTNNLSFTIILANQRDIGSKNLPILRLQGQQLANKLQCPFVDVPSGTYTRKFHEFQIKQALRGLLEALKNNLNVVSPLPSIKDLSEADLRIVMCAMCGDPFNVDLILSPFLESQFCSAAQPGHSNSLLLEKIIGEKRKRIQITILSYHSSICVRKDELVHGYILVYSAKRKASMAMLRAFLAEVQDVIPVQLVAVTDSQADFFENEAIKELMTEGEHIATEISAKFTAIYSLSQYHRQTEVFTPFFSEVLEKKSSIENSYMYDSTRESTNVSEDFSLSPRASSPACNYYPDSEDDNEAPPPYSPIGDEVQLLPPSNDRSKYRSDFEGTEYPIHSSPVVNHENHKVPPPIKPKPAVSRHDVRKLDPNLVKTIEQVIGKNPRRNNRTPFSHPDDLDPTDNYSVPRDSLLKPKMDDEIYSIPQDSKSSKIIRKPTMIGGNNSQGEEENGLIDRSSKQPIMRKPSKYKYKSKTLFRKAKLYYRRRERFDISDDETVPSSSRKPKKGKTHRGSEEDPLLSPESCGKAGIDNPAIASDPEVDDIRRHRKDKKPAKPKQQKPNKKGHKPALPARRNWESNYFGVPLEDVVTPDNPVPAFIERCVEYIESTGLNTEGLYRVSGNRTDQDNIQRQFDQDHNIDLVAMDVTVNAVAGALKAFFSDLPEPLIPYNLHSELLEAARLIDISEKLNAFKELLKKFPPVSFEVFKYIITHLNRVSQQSKTNRMVADNLAICFWPTFLRPDALTNAAINQSAIETFIQQYQFLFHNGDIVDTFVPPGAPCTGQLVEPLLPLPPLPPPPQPSSQPFPSEMQTDQLDVI